MKRQEWVLEKNDTSIFAENLKRIESRGKTVRFEIYKCLLYNNKPLSATQIATQIRRCKEFDGNRPTSGTVSGTLHKMLKNKEVEIFDKHGGPSGGKTWKLSQKKVLR